MINPGLSATTIEGMTLEELVDLVVGLLEQRSTGVGEFPVAGSLNGISSLPALRGAGTTNEVVTVSLSLLKGVDGVDGKTAKFSVGTVGSSVAGGPASVTLSADGLDENANPKFKLNFILPRGQNGAGIVVRVTASAVQYKYEGEADGAYRTMFTIEQLRLKFSDLTAAQKDELTLHFSDLTAANLATLKQPATDAAAALSPLISATEAAKNGALSAGNYAASSAANAEAAILLMEQLMQSVSGSVSLSPVKMLLSYPDRLTIGNAREQRISVRLLPIYSLQNALYLSDNVSVEVEPDGLIGIKRAGLSRIHVIPTSNTSLYRTITIEVVSPGMRLLSGSRLRLVDTEIRLT